MQQDLSGAAGGPPRRFRTVALALMAGVAGGLVAPLLYPSVARNARPVISSLTPSEYMSAVSKKLMPLSTARRKNGRLAASSSTQGRQAGLP